MINWNDLTPAQKIDILARPKMETDILLQETVAEIIRQVVSNQDQALNALTYRFDKVRLDAFQVSESEIESALERLDADVRKALDQTYSSIRSFHAPQVEGDIALTTMEGVECTLRSRPLKSVGLYIPGGDTPLCSTVLMLGVPAQLAGIPQLVMVSPPNQQGTLAPEIIYAAQKCGITEIYKVGGAQAIAALAYGTPTIPKVDKIFGPGNRFVTEAKRQVSQVPGLVGIDMPAGPSEVLVIADKHASPDFIAADLLAQAEHGPDSQVILVSDSENLILQVEASVKIQLAKLPRQDIASRALEHARYIRVKDLDEALAVSERYAPEHLILNSINAATLVEQVRNAGSIFVGPWSPESAGDYASGTNHVLPTAGTARFMDSLSIKDFQKRSTIQVLSRQGLENLGQTVITLARAEGLEAHAQAVRIRLEGRF